MAIKITFLGAGSSVFVRNVLGDCIIHPELEDLTFALYDIDAQRLEDSYLMLHAICSATNRELVVGAPENAVLATRSSFLQSSYSLIASNTSGVSMVTAS